jgi:hypothetical protein
MMAEKRAGLNKAAAAREVDPESLKGLKALTKVRSSRRGGRAGCACMEGWAAAMGACAGCWQPRRWRRLAALAGTGRHRRGGAAGSRGTARAQGLPALLQPQRAHLLTLPTHHPPTITITHHCRRRRWRRPTPWPCPPPRAPRPSRARSSRRCVASGLPLPLKPRAVLRAAGRGPPSPPPPA